MAKKTETAVKNTKIVKKEKGSEKKEDKSLELATTPKKTKSTKKVTDSTAKIKKEEKVVKTKKEKSAQKKTKPEEKEKPAKKTSKVVASVKKEETKPVKKEKTEVPSGETATPVKKEQKIESKPEKVIKKTTKVPIQKQTGSIQNRKKYKKEKRISAKTQAEQETAEKLAKKNVIKIGDALTVNILAQELKINGVEIIKKLMGLGVLATLNQKLDFETASIIADEYGYELQLTTLEDIKKLGAETSHENLEDLEPRPPVITIMGHVDHGKTSLLDSIRKSDIVSGEAGGITQHIGAYQISTKFGNLTFLDTPGHAAFTAMRARGVQATDIVIIVVAANDGIMPQTIEAINHAKAAQVPIIVAINKTDLPDANPDKVLKQLASYGLTSEDWGGETIVVKISAKTGAGIENLLEMISIQAEMMELKATQKGKAKGVIIEAELDKKRGAVATVLIQNGVLKKGDAFISGISYGRIREIIDDRGRKQTQVLPATPVEILGLNGVPDAGDVFAVVESEKEAKRIVEKRQELIREERLSRKKLITLEDLNLKMKNEEFKELNIIIKADVKGSVEALRDSLERMSNNLIKLVVIHSGVGMINESDLMLATASNAILVSFNLDIPTNIKIMAEQKGVELRSYKIIYEAIDEIKAAMEGLLEPEIEQELVGKVEIRQIINIPKIGLIAGCMVVDGKIEKSGIVKVVRNNSVIFEGKIEQLKRFKDNVKEVDKGYECGVSLVNFTDYQEKDMLEVYKENKILKKLAASV